MWRFLLHKISAAFYLTNPSKQFLPAIITLKIVFQFSTKNNDEFYSLVVAGYKYLFNTNVFYFNLISKKNLHTSIIPPTWGSWNCSSSFIRINLWKYNKKKCLLLLQHLSQKHYDKRQKKFQYEISLKKQHRNFGAELKTRYLT